MFKDDDSTNPELYYERGLVYFKQQNYDKAIEHFKSTIKLKPNYPEARMMLEFAQKII